MEHTHSRCVRARVSAGLDQTDPRASYANCQRRRLQRRCRVRKRPARGAAGAGSDQLEDNISEREGLGGVRLENNFDAIQRRNGGLCDCPRDAPRQEPLADIQRRRVCLLLGLLQQVRAEAVGLLLARPQRARALQRGCGHGAPGVRRPLLPFPLPPHPRGPSPPPLCHCEDRVRGCLYACSWDTPGREEEERGDTSEDCRSRVPGGTDSVHNDAALCQ